VLISTQQRGEKSNRNGGIRRWRGLERVRYYPSSYAGRCQFEPRMKSTNKVVPFRRPVTRSESSGPGDCAEERRENRHLWVHAMLFTAVALMVYTAAVLAAPGEGVEKLWLVWLIFVVAASKLLVANGFIFAAIGADRKESARQAAKPRAPALRARLRRHHPPIRPTAPRR